MTLIYLHKQVMALLGDCFLLLVLSIGPQLLKFVLPLFLKGNHVLVEGIRRSHSLLTASLFYNLLRPSTPHISRAFTT